MLVLTQFFLLRRMRRTFNPALIAATLVALVPVWRSSSVLDSATQRLTTARDGPYAALYALTQARVVGYAANTDNSPWLLSQEAPAYLASFDDGAKQMSTPPLTHDLVEAAHAGLRQRRALPFIGPRIELARSPKISRQAVRDFMAGLTDASFHSSASAEFTSLP